MKWIHSRVSMEHAKLLMYMFLLISDSYSPTVSSWCPSDYKLVYRTPNTRTISVMNSPVRPYQHLSECYSLHNNQLEHLGDCPQDLYQIAQKISYCLVHMDTDIVAQYEPPRDCGDARCRDVFWEFIYCVVIPCAVLFIVVLITSILMCCGSCKRKKKAPPCDETQLLRYNSIRHASLSLRQLSYNRDTPLLSHQADRQARTASLNLERDSRYRRGMHGTSSAPGTLQRDRDRRHRHQQDRHSELVPPGYTVPHDFPSQGLLNLGSGVEYSEVDHGLTAAGVTQERLIA